MCESWIFESRSLGFHPEPSDVPIHSARLLVTRFPGRLRRSMTLSFLKSIARSARDGIPSYVASEPPRRQNKSSLTLGTGNSQWHPTVSHATSYGPSLHIKLRHERVVVADVALGLRDRPVFSAVRKVGPAGDADVFPHLRRAEDKIAARPVFKESGG